MWLFGVALLPGYVRTKLCGDGQKKRGGTSSSAQQKALIKKYRAVLSGSLEEVCPASPGRGIYPKNSGENCFFSAWGLTQPFQVLSPPSLKTPAGPPERRKISTQNSFTQAE